MTRPKTKRIVWTLTVLLALSFVAVMVLPKHPEPRIIGDLSKEDASTILRLVLHNVRVRVRDSITDDLHDWEIKKSITEARYYSSMRVISLNAQRDGLVHVTVRINRDVRDIEVLAQKMDGKWTIVYPVE